MEALHIAEQYKFEADAGDVSKLSTKAGEGHLVAKLEEARGEFLGALKAQVRN